MSYNISLITKITRSAIFKDSFWALLGSVAKQALSLFSGILIARFLGKDVYGEFGTIKTTLTYIAIMSTFGFGYTATKYVAEYLDCNKNYLKSLVNGIIKITLVFSSFLGLLLLLFATEIARFIDAPYLDNCLRYSSIIVVLNALNSTQIGILSGFKEFKRLAVINSYSGVVTFVSAIVLTYYYGIDGAIISLLVSFLFQVILNWQLINRILSPYNTFGKIDKRTIRGLLSFSLPIALQESLYTIVHWSGTLVLIKFADYGEVGISSAAAIWQSVVIFIPGVLKNVMFSHLTTADNHKRIVNKLLCINFVSTIIPFLFVFVLSDYIVALYGTSFGELKSVLIVQIFSAIFICLSEVYCYEFISIGRPWFVFVSRFIRDMGGVILGLLLILNTLGCEAFYMSIASLVMNVFYLGMLFLLNKNVN